MKDETDQLKKPRTALQIAERLLALVAVVARANRQEWVEEWAKRFRIFDYFSLKEKKFFQSRSPVPQSTINFSWRAEALVSMVWSLGGLQDMPPLSEQYWVLDSDFIEAAMKNPHAFRLSVSTRPQNEISDMESHLYHQHWRVRDRQLGFNNGAAIPLKPCELPIDQLNASVVYERRYALSWIMGWGDDWDDVPTDT